MTAAPRSMRVVHEQFEKLEHVVDNLNEKTRGLLLRERREFLAAYRAHTFKIQNELAELRKRVAEEQSSQQKDEKVKQLRDDCDWFRQEALDLDAEGSSLRDELHSLKDRLEQSEDDRNWLLKELTRTIARAEKRDAAAATWRVRGDESRRRRGRDVDILRKRVPDAAAATWRRIAATPRPRRGSSAETSPTPRRG